MLNIDPNDFYNGLNPYRSDPWNRQQQLRAAQLRQHEAKEEERRQKRLLHERDLREEHSRRNEMRRMEKTEQKQREAEQHRRILGRQQKLQRQEEREREKRREQMEREKKQKWREHYLRDAEYGIMRGSDGRLYRLNDDYAYGQKDGRATRYPFVDSSGQRTHGPAENRNASSTLRRMTRSRNKEIYSLREENGSDEEYSSSKGNEETPTSRTQTETDETLSASTGAKKKEKKAKKKPRDSRETMLSHSVLIGGVEDVSDDEQDDSCSVWNNRVPSEGEWMEPVEGIGVVYW